MPQQTSRSNVLLLVGDSDVSRWPAELLPQCCSAIQQTITSGHSGATLQEIIPNVKAAIENENGADSLVLVACAGENDIGNGCSLDETLSAFQELVHVFFPGDTTTTRRLIFLGPKLEPWLEDDPLSRKQYVKLSKALQRACNKHERCNEIVFVDCLTMFCGDSGNLPGALYGGAAKADPHYFANDRLHLSNEGYQVWKQAVEDHLSDILTSNGPTTL